VTVHVIGLTGGIASGKSTVARLLADRGAIVIDADQLARQVVEPGQPALAELVARFGAAILASDGQLDRKRLAAIAFADPAARADLGRITHPRIAAASAAAIATWADAGATIVFYEAALLVENRAHAGLAGLIVVATPPEVQCARLVERDRLTPDEARARVAAQAPLADKLAVATWVVENVGDLAALEREVARVVADIEARLGPIRAPRLPRAETGRPGRIGHAAALVTGFPAFTARRMIAQLRAAEPDTVLYVLASDAAASDAERTLAGLPERGQAEVLVGDVGAMDLGLSSAEYRTLARELTWIHHLAGAYLPGDADARRVNVAGTRSVLELARDAVRLERVVHWSTTMVAGDHVGTWYEHDLESGQRHHHAYEHTKFEAERLVRAAMRQLPITVVRPGIIVGDSRTGEIGPFDGPHDLVSAIVADAGQLRRLLLDRGDAPLCLVPIDYVVEAAWHVARGEAAAGKTFHLVDPSPHRTRAVIEAIASLDPAAPVPAARGERRGAGSLVRAVRRASGRMRLRRGPLALADRLPRAIHYDQRNTTSALARTTVRCPALLDYVAALVRYARQAARAEPVAGLDDVNDPLDD
jgi:dephospho-CoA kinase